MSKVNKEYLKVVTENYDYIVAKWKTAQEEAMTKFNGFENNDEGDVKQLIHNSIALKASYEIFHNLKLENYFTKQYTEKLFKILNKRNDYELFQYMFEDTLFDDEEPKILSLLQAKERIDGTLEHFDFIKNSIYQAFYFRNSMKEVYYQGNLYLGADELPEDEKHEVVEEICQLKDPDDFFPTLQKDIEKIIGEENSDYDGFEIGTNGFMMFWNITTDKYPNAINKLNDWVKYHELEKHMCFRIKNNLFPKRYIGSVGDEEIIKEYYCINEEE